ncbi:MAG: hypothetical protein IPK32_08185 [Verrucomicrobiaceae bacterium]|nr:hypothetical protein [Verrucomicrobiaceae bacterium]
MLCLRKITLIYLCLSGMAVAHVVPSTEIEARFEKEDRCVLAINLDPRAFLAADPTQLPPVPGSWYREQTPAQATATHTKCREYLEKALSPLLDGKKVPLPHLDIQPIDGADNHPLRPDTAELHFLATVALPLPTTASTFQIDYSKSAKTDLILFHTSSTESDRRFQAVFPGETSRAFRFRAAAPAPPASSAVATTTPAPAATYTTLALIVAVTAVVAGWLLLRKYRHHHRGHRPPRQD